MFNKNTTIEEVINRVEFETFGRLLFPVDLNLSKKTTLDEISTTLPWYNFVKTNRTVEILNQFLKWRTEEKTIFYNIYTEEEMKKDPRKRNTGLFYFPGNVNSKVAIVSAGGGFQYVGAIHDSFPHCLEISKKGYNAFALIYRPGAKTACEDLARAISFLHENQEKLGINMQDYSLWGGSAGARLGTYGTQRFGEKDYPRPSAVIMQYTGFSEVTGEEVPTFATVGTNDWIASYRTMKHRIETIKKQGVKAEIKIYKNLPHGFGLGEGTIAEGWINEAMRFWEEEGATQKS